MEDVQAQSQIQAAEIAKEAMEKGCNCCESVLTAANVVLNLNLSQDTMAAAGLFREGMGAGCTCGALVGMVMASGIMQNKLGLPKDEKFAAKLHQRFKQEFGSSCCVVLHKNQSLIDRIGKRGCIRITSKAASMLVEAWGSSR